jgi:hypothetical protein
MMKLEKIWEEVVMAKSKYYPSMCMETDENFKKPQLG